MSDSGARRSACRAPEVDLPPLVSPPKLQQLTLILERDFCDGLRLAQPDPQCIYGPISREGALLRLRFGDLLLTVSLGHDLYLGSLRAQ